MKEFLLKYKNSVFIALITLTFIFILLSKKTTTLPIITAFTPVDQSQNVDLRAIPKYISDTPLLLSDLELSSSPPFNLQLTTVDQNTFTATHALAFQPATTYTLTLSWKGHPLQTHSFTTIKSQEDPLLIQNMKDELKRDYPLAQLLPYTTSQYRVVYSAPLTLEIALKNPNLTSEEVIAEIKNWVTKNGGDATIHRFTTTISPPTTKP